MAVERDSRPVGGEALPGELSVFQAMIQALPLPIGFVDFDGKIIFANASLRQIQSCSDYFISDEHLRFASPSVNRQFRLKLDAMKQARSRHENFYVKPQRHGERVRPLLWMHLQKLSAQGIMISIYAPNVATVNSDTLKTRLRQLFDLSDAEADTALCLSKGLSAANIAKDRAVSLPTIRTQLSAIRHKMDVASSLEAVVQITKLSLPF